MSGIASAAIMGGAALAGSIGSGLLAKSGADSASGSNSAAAANANLQLQQQRTENRSDLSPWTSTGTSAIGQIGALLGYGSLWNRGGNGATYNYETDPAAQGNAFAQLQSYLKGSGITAPTFTPINTVSSTFTADPSYAFRQAEGQKALERGAAARGKLLSGQQFKGLEDYNSNLASQEYGNWFQRWMAQNAYNWGGQKDQFGLQYGQYRDALGDVYSAAGMGQGAANSLAGQNSGLSTSGANALVGGAASAGQATMQGANSLASGIGSGINNALTAAYLGGAFTGNSSYSPEANVSGFLRGQGPAGPSGRY